MFITGKPVTGKNFIDRKKHLPLFQTYLEQNQSFMIKAPRRFGKTSIIKHLLEGKKEFIYIDVKRVSSLKSLANNIINSAYKLSSIDNFILKAKESLFDLIKSIQRVKIDDIGEITIKLLEKQDLDEIEYFLHSLDIVEKIAIKKDINVKLVFDEFQDILLLANKDILDKARSVMQHHNNITYIFLGSIESIMSKIFENKSSPFFHFATILDLPPLDIDELYQYSIKIFNKEKIQLQNLKDILIYLNGHPDYSIQFLQKVYFIAKANGENIFLFQQLKNILIEVILTNKPYLEEIITKVKQKKHHLEVLEAIANNIKINLDSKTLYNVHISLENYGIIKKIGLGKYKINDIFLKIYLMQNDYNDIRLIGI